MIFRQLFDGQSSTFSYLLGDPRTRQAVIIDRLKIASKPPGWMGQASPARPAGRGARGPLARATNPGLSNGTSLRAADGAFYADRSTRGWADRAAGLCAAGAAVFGSVDGAVADIADHGAAARLAGFRSQLGSCRTVLVGARGRLVRFGRRLRRGPGAATREYGCTRQKWGDERLVSVDHGPRLAQPKSQRPRPAPTQSRSSRATWRLPDCLGSTVQRRQMIDGPSLREGLPAHRA